MVNFLQAGVLDILKEGLLGSLGTIKNLVLIIIPLMIVIQIMNDYKWLERLSHKTKFITDFFGMSKDTLVPLLIGMFAGISYGAGAILFAKEQYNLEKRDIFLAMCFLAPCHGIVEIALIFWLIGVNPVFLLIARFAVAIPATLFFKWRLDRRDAARLEGPDA